jgi:hypothetical protein
MIGRDTRRDVRHDSKQHLRLSAFICGLSTLRNLRLFIRR